MGCINRKGAHNFLIIPKKHYSKLYVVRKNFDEKTSKKVPPLKFHISGGGVKLLNVEFRRNPLTCEENKKV